jgi:hypothetical protein
MLQKIAFKPGINTQVSRTANEGGWSDGNLVRFRDGLLETWSGWEPIISTKLTGVCRSSFAWLQLDGIFNVAFGYDSTLKLLHGDVLYDITPASGGSLPVIPPPSGGGSGTLGYGSGTYGSGTFGTPRS